MQTLDLESGDDPRDPPSSPVRLALYSAAVAVVLVLGSVMVSNGAPVDGYRPLPTPGPTTPRRPPGPIALREVCPVRTDHRNHLTVSFRLANTSRTSTMVISVVGDPPTGGLRQERKTLSGGTCEQPGKQRGRAELAEGGTRLYTVRWKLPDTCPESYPLQVRVMRQEASGPVKSYVVVLPDLDGIGFDQCPHVVTEFPSEDQGA